ncbi:MULTISPECIES: hypothetical protein [Lysinibacillus]|uniref:hypothetical protein n=1 Tax=Lysinibacillus sp. FJAT-14222 TaxID=1932366 RepID=UPI000B2FCEC4|nr:MULTISPECIES: hypothetical protein [Lysinibacillus]
MIVTPLFSILFNNLLIFEQYQGQRYGKKKAMKEAEIMAKELGMNKIGLNLFVIIKLHVAYTKKWVMKLRI